MQTHRLTMTFVLVSLVLTGCGEFEVVAPMKRMDVLRPRSCDELSARLEAQREARPEPTVIYHRAAAHHDDLRFDPGVRPAAVMQPHRGNVYAVDGERLWVLGEDGGRIGVVSSVSLGGKALGLTAHEGRVAVVVGMTQEAAAARDTELPVRPVDAKLTRVVTYDVAEPARPQLIRSTFVEGPHHATWRVGRHLYVVTRPALRVPSQEKRQPGRAPRSLPYVSDDDLVHGSFWASYDDADYFCQNVAAPDLAERGRHTLFAGIDTLDARVPPSAALVLDDVRDLRVGPRAAVFLRANEEQVELEERRAGVYMHRVETSGGIVDYSGFGQLEGLVPAAAFHERTGTLHVGTERKLVQMRATAERFEHLHSSTVAWGSESIEAWRFDEGRVYGISRKPGEDRTVWEYVLDEDDERRVDVVADLDPAGDVDHFEIRAGLVDVVTTAPVDEGEDEAVHTGRVATPTDDGYRVDAIYQFRAPVGAPPIRGYVQHYPDLRLQAFESPASGAFRFFRDTGAGPHLAPAAAVEHSTDQSDEPGIPHATVQTGDLLWVLSEVGVSLVDLNTLDTSNPLLL